PRQLLHLHRDARGGRANRGDLQGEEDVEEIGAGAGVRDWGLVGAHRTRNRKSKVQDRKWKTFIETICWITTRIRAITARSSARTSRTKRATRCAATRSAST